MDCLAGMIVALLSTCSMNLISTGLIPRSLLRSLVTQYPAACCGVVYSFFGSSRILVERASQGKLGPAEPASG